MNGCEANVLFASKGLMKQKPWQVLIVSLMVTTFIWGYILKIFESPLNEISGQDFQSL
jgi:RsiW-degrading membrane proteinase PrsW (M82 family)